MLQLQPILAKNNIGRYTKRTSRPTRRTMSSLSQPERQYPRILNVSDSKYVDTHTHIDMTMKKLKLPITSFAEFASENFPSNWDGCVQVSCTPGAITPTLHLINNNPKVWGSFGIHPHDANTYTKEIEQKISSAQAHLKCVAWGEIGLDYHYNHSPRETQRQVFEQQLKMAIEHKKPIVIHTREAEEDTFTIMKNIVPESWPIHVHCFTSSLPFAHQLLNHWKNLFIGFTGVITFTSAKELHQTVTEVPLSRIVVETDAPFMAPVPHRGKVCHSGLIPHIVQRIATLKNQKVDEVYQVTRQNTKQLYGI